MTAGKNFLHPLETVSFPKNNELPLPEYYIGPPTRLYMDFNRDTCANRHLSLSSCCHEEICSTSLLVLGLPDSTQPLVT